MITVYSKQKEEKTIKVIEVTLLSEEELESCAEYVTPPAYFEPRYWYLRGEYDDNMVGMAAENSFEEPTDPNYEDFPPHGPFGTGLRPVLKIEACEHIKVGDKVRISDPWNNWDFTAISDKILLSDLMIGYDSASNSYGIFDEETNVYEESAAKKRVDEWFETCIKDYL